MPTLLLILVSCTGGHGSSVDSGMVTDGLVPVQGGDPDGFSQVKTLFIALFPQTWDTASASSTKDGASLLAVEFKAPAWVPFPSSEEADTCWRRHSIALGGDQVDLGKQVMVSFGNTEITLPAYGRLYEATLEGDDEVAATTAGAAVRLEGQDTTFVVPEAIVVDDLAGSAEALATDTLLHLRWTPSELPGFVEVQAIDHTDSGLWCALEDDGSADIDLGEVAQTAEHLSIGHVARGTFEHATLGNTFVDLERTITVALP